MLKQSNGTQRYCQSEFVRNKMELVFVTGS